MIGDKGLIGLPGDPGELGEKVHTQKNLYSLLILLHCREIQEPKALRVRVEVWETKE